VNHVQKNAVISITKATELFLIHLAEKSNEIASKRRGKTIKASDILYAIHREENLQFLRKDFPRKLLDPKDIQAIEKVSHPKIKKDNKPCESSTAIPITQFFKKQDFVGDI